MLKKKATLITFETFLRVIIICILIVSLIGCVTKSLYPALFGSKTQDSYDKMVAIINTLDYDNPTTHNLYLDEGNAIIAFAKDSDKIEYIGNPFNSYFERKDIENCEKGTACICLCKEKFKETAGKLDLGHKPVAVICEKKIECKPLYNSDFPSEIKIEEIGDNLAYLGREYKFKGGFYFAEYKKVKQYNEQSPEPVKEVRELNPYYPFFSYSPQQIYLKKDRNNIVYISIKPFEYSP